MTNSNAVRRSARRIAGLALLALAGIASTHAASATSPALGEPTSVASIANAPASVPHDYVVTPNGFFHPSCVQRIGVDETVMPGGSVRKADGSVRNVPACAYPHFAADGTRLQHGAIADVPQSTLPVQPEQINGWMAYAVYTLPSQNSAFYIAADMAVPNAPSINSGQVVYFFPGLEDLEAVQTIVQPVLGWDAFNDSAWSIASWNCCMDGQTWHSAPVAVQAGVTLEGIVSGTSCTGGVCSDWQIVTRDPSTGHETTLNTSGYGQAFDWVFGAVLESYGISQCGELPATVTEEFSRVAVRTLAAPTARVTAKRPAWTLWTITNPVNCDYAVTPHPQLNSPQITIDY